MYWKIPLCRRCHIQIRNARSVFVWLNTLSEHDVRLLRVHGYFEWAYYYEMHADYPMLLTDVYDINSVFVWQEVRII